jgi:hypothetical protein
MEKQMIYRLEFNEKYQKFHLSYNKGTEENTNGWFTIFDNCTDLEFRIYESYVNRVPKRKITKNYLLKSANEVKRLINNLLEWNIIIDSEKSLRDGTSSRQNISLFFNN